MADAQRVIEFLRDVRQGGLASLQAATPEVAQMAADYAALCAQANERLRQCSAFLQQGLRGEAIHLAEQSPNLLDLVAQLDLPDPQAWAEFCQNNGLPVPPPLQFERAAQLNEAYAQDQPLEHLLARHRLLALSRAPLRERLAVMRKIAEMDVTSSHWDKDLREFEVARQKELPAEFHGALKRHDDQTVRAIMSEVGETWREPPPADLVAAVTDAYARLQRTAVEADLQKLVEPLRDAFAARSFQECQALVARWKNTMASGGVTHVSAELMDEIKPVAQFVSEQVKREDLLKRFNDACRAFTKLLDSDAGDAPLEAGYARLKEFHEDIPEDLIKRYAGKKAGRRQEADRRHKSKLMLIGGAALAVIVVGLGITLLVERGSNARGWAARINDAVAKRSKEGLDQGQQMVDQLQKTNAGLLKEPKVAEAVGALQALAAQYDDDQKAIREHIESMTKARQAAGMVMANANATLDDLRAGGQQLDDALNKANAAKDKLKWADSDQALAQHIADTTTAWKSMQERLLAAFQKELQAVGTDLDAVPTTTATPDAADRVKAQLTALAGRAQALASMPMLDDDARTALAAVTGRIKERQGSAAATGDVAAELERIRNANRSSAELRGALEAFVSRFPDDPHTAEFKKALEMIPAAAALEAWEQLAATYKDDLRATTAEKALKRAADVDAFAAAHPSNPKAGDVAAYAQYLHAAADAMGDKGTWQTAMADLLNNPLLRDLQVMQLSDGRRFYTRGEVKRTEHRINSTVSVSFEAIDPAGIEKPDQKDPEKSLAQRLIVTIDPPTVVPDAPVPAPHAKLMSEITDDLKLINDANWDTYGIDLADRIINDPQIDLVVKAIFLQQVLKTQRAVAPGRYGIGDAYDHAITDLARQDPNDLFWFDPPKISEGTRKALTQIIGTIPSARATKAKLADGRKALFDAIGGATYVSGVLMKDDAGAWALRTRAQPDNGSTLWAIIPAPDASAATPDKTPTVFTQVGTAVGAKFTLDQDKIRTMPQGTIVYVHH